MISPTAQEIKKSRLRRDAGEPHGKSSCGLRGVAIRDQAEVAQIMGVSRQFVQQIERTAMWKIRKRMAAEISEMKI